MTPASDFLNLKAALDEIKALRVKAEDELNRSAAYCSDITLMGLEVKVRSYKDAERIIRRHMRAAKKATK